MGTYEKPKYAYMIPTLNGEVMEDDMQAAGGYPIYQIDPDTVVGFKRKFDMGGVVFVPLYSGIIQYPAPVVQTRKKKNERSE